MRENCCLSELVQITQNVYDNRDSEEDGGTERISRAMVAVLRDHSKQSRERRQKTKIRCRMHFLRGDMSKGKFLGALRYQVFG